MSEPLRLEPIEDFDSVGRDWDRLAVATGHPFATREWNRTWWGRFGGGRSLYTFACRDEGGSVRAILPLYVAKSRPFGIARFLGYADLASPVCGSEDRPLAARAMMDATRAPHRCRLIYAERLPGSEGWGEMLGGPLLRTGNDPVLSLRGRSWEDVIGRRSRKSRATLRRKERRLAEDHGLTIRLSTDPDRLAADMDILIDLHAKRWRAETTGVFEGDRGRFHRDFAGLALARGWLRLWIAEVDGEPAAAWYGWRFAGSDWHFQGGRDPRFDRLSVGAVLYAHTIREACRDGMDCYRFLAGFESYKKDYAETDLGIETRMVGAPALAAGGGLAWKAATAVRPLRRPSWRRRPRQTAG